MDINSQLNAFVDLSYNMEDQSVDFVNMAPMDRTRGVIQKYLENSVDYRMSVLQAVETFTSFSETTLRNCAHCMEDCFYTEGSVIFHQEEIGDSFYIIESGELIVLKKKDVNDPDEEPKELIRLGKDAHFGQIALITEEPRSATIKVISSEAKLLKMTKDVFSEIQAQHKALQEMSHDKIAMHVLESVSFIKNQPQAIRYKVMKAMNSVNFSSNNYICRQGSVGNTFYVITEGMCKVTILTEEGNEKEVAKMYPGDYFGEVALIQADAIRTANVISVGFVTCLCLSREDFNTLLNTSKSIIMEQSMMRSSNDRSGDKKQSYIKGPLKRQISVIDQTTGSKSNTLVQNLFIRLAKFHSEASFLNMYWKYFRKVLIDPNSREKYGRIISDIIDIHSNSRFTCVQIIRDKAIEILSMKPRLRNHEEHLFVYGLLSSKNHLREYCSGWKEQKFKKLCHFVYFGGTYNDMVNINNVGEKGNTAMIILKGAVRTFSIQIDTLTRRPKKTIEEDMMSGEMFHVAALGGMHERLLGATTISKTDILLIDENSYIDARGNDVYQLSTEEKFKYLQKVPVFKNWDNYNLYLIAQEIEHVDHGTGAKILETGKWSDNISFLLHGSISFLSNTNRTSVLSKVQMFEIIGESSVLNFFFGNSTFNTALDIAEIQKGRNDLANRYPQSKRDRRNIRNKKRIGHPDIYYEHTDAVADCHVELLIFKRKKYSLLNAAFASEMRKVYYQRAVWRANSSQLLSGAEMKIYALEKSFVAAANKANLEDNPEASYKKAIPSPHVSGLDDEGNELLDYPNANDSLSSQVAQEISHGSMHQSIQALNLHVSTKGKNLEELIILPIIDKRPVKVTLGVTGGGYGRPKTRAGKYGEDVMTDLEDIPKIVMGTLNPISLLGIAKNDKQRRQSKELINRNKKIRSAHEKYSRLGNNSKTSGLKRSLSRHGTSNLNSRPNTTGGVRNNQIMEESVTFEDNIDYNFLDMRGSHMIHNKKCYSDQLLPREVLRFRPSINKVRSKRDYKIT